MLGEMLCDPRRRGFRLVQPEVVVDDTMMPLGEKGILFFQQDLGLGSAVPGQVRKEIILLVQGLGLVELHQKIEVFRGYAVQFQGFAELQALALGEVARALEQVGHIAGAGNPQSGIGGEGAHGITGLDFLAVAEPILEETAEIQVLGDIGGRRLHRSLKIACGPRPGPGIPRTPAHK
jgi:hypothetical protein